MDKRKITSATLTSLVCLYLSTGEAAASAINDVKENNIESIKKISSVEKINEDVIQLSAQNELQIKKVIDEDKLSFNSVVDEQVNVSEKSAKDIDEKPVLQDYNNLKETDIEDHITENISKIEEVNTVIDDAEGIEVENTYTDNYFTSEKLNSDNNLKTIYVSKLVLNNDQLPDANKIQINELLSKYDNHNLSMNDFNKIISDINTYLRNNKYPAASAYLPEQNSIDGVVTIGVELGHYGNIIIENDSHISNRTLKMLTSVLHKGNVITNRELESVTYNIINLGGISAATIIQPGENIGESDIYIKVKEVKKHQFNVHFDNFGSPSTGKNRTFINGSMYGIDGLGNKLSYNLMKSNKKQLSYGFQYEQLVNSYGTKLGFGINYGNYELGSDASSLGAEGKSTTFSIYGRTPVWSTSKSSFGITYGLDYRTMKDELSLVDYSVEKHSYVFKSGIYGYERYKKAMLNYDMELSFGSLTGDKAHIGNIPLSIGNEGQFFKFNLNNSFMYLIDNKFDIVSRISWQQAGSSLDSSEKMFLGGPNGVRAYPQGESSGDNGIFATSELRYHTPIKNMILSAYFDIGHVSSYNTNISPSDTLKGYGVAISWDNSKDLIFRLDYARRIGLSEHASESARSSDRVWFSLNKTW